jgi:UDP-N-acetylglucosamine--N-acetylmuramyl-(pentapeptide) pyrophosphoryl-undecaprenol N-acetylglucosamine transferase
MRVIITGGGTGGHIYPALAIAKGLLKENPKAEILYVGTEKGLEADIVPRDGYNFKTVTVEGLPRNLSLKLIKTGFKLLRGIGQAAKIIKDFQPDVVIGTGGYVCGPVVLMAALLGFSTVIHEQNAYPGITNKILARFVDKVLVTFPESIKYFPAKAPCLLTGLPIRQEILRVSTEEGLKNLNLKAQKPLILVVGGSRGARSLNVAMVGVIEEFYRSKQAQILHVTGQSDYQDTIERLKLKGISLEEDGDIILKPYIYNMQDALACADLIICRAGATTLAEITAKGIPAILIPYPYASENHQEHNARSLEKRGAAILIKDKDLTGDDLAQTLKDLLNQQNKLQAMEEASLSLGKPQALDDIINEITNISKKKANKNAR